MMTAAYERGEQANVQCVAAGPLGPGRVCTSLLPGIYVQAESDAEDTRGTDTLSETGVCDEIQETEDWSDSKEAQVMRKVTVIKEGRVRGYRKPCLIRPARGSALHAPAQRFYVSYTPTFHVKLIGNILLQGTGVGRTGEQPTSLARCTNKAAQINLTGHLLNKLLLYFRTQSVRLSQFTVRQSLQVTALTNLYSDSTVLLSYSSG